MIRVEERKVFGSKIAWVPRGPTGSTSKQEPFSATGTEHLSEN